MAYVTQISWCWKVKPGDRITITATEVAVYGIHCTTERSQPGLLLIPYISWIPCFNSCQQFAKRGDVIEAAVRFVDPGTGKIALTHCEMFDDPWESGDLRPKY
ncbi:hypothetical protein LOC67_17045 [Stieleria sp. JC731]|uniref:hypothetical protein n=1 Tax=Stieleria sp. JC731 TaxID=2894195 RepID=UPI001E3041CB|nr:hypothetical protein [Stieleria sp. JC731]MCC9602264.1 hypothetical protein [Stieleria sp. JC731]